MSKVYSFRLSDNNPRDVQAKKIINAWISQGYSLRSIVIDALISYRIDDGYKGELEEIIEKITHLLTNSDRVNISTSTKECSLPKVFVESISKSVKSGLKLE